MPDLKEATERANQFSNLLEKGDANSLQKALSELGGALERGAQDAGEQRRVVRREPLPAGEQDHVRGPAQAGRPGGRRALAGRRQRRAGAGDWTTKLAKEMAAEMDKFVAETREKLETLRSRLGTPTPRELGEDGDDELKRAQESAKQMRRLLPEREWGEAKKEAERAVSSLRRLRRELDEKAQAEAPSASAASWRSSTRR